MPEKHRPWVRKISWLAVILVMGIIFMLSAEHAAQSDHLSLGFSAFIVKMMEKLMPGIGWQASEINGLVRKGAHFIAYLVLGTLTINACRRSSLTMRKAGLMAFILCLLYAGLDEWHQYFVPGRSAQVWDVLLDSSGALLGFCLYCFGEYIWRKGIRIFDWGDKKTLS